MLPYDMLSKISSKADRRTQARMRMMDRTTRADPLLRVRNPPKGKGYMYGTGGALQKVYNDMPRKLRVLRASLAAKAASETTAALRAKWSRLQAEVDGYVDEFGMYKKEYLRSKYSSFMSDEAVESFEVSRFATQQPSYDQEEFMAQVLSDLNARVGAIARELGSQPPAANVARHMRANHQIEKRHRVFPRERPGARQARHLAARAARRAVATRR